MKLELFDQLRASQPTQAWPVDPLQVIGYSESELATIEKLYDIQICGDFRNFMLEMGRCSGGLIGDDPIVLYRPLWSVRTQILFQCGFYQSLSDSKIYGLIPQKPFVFSREHETQYYFLLTGSDSPGLVYHYDENHQTVRSTGLSFMEYMQDAVTRYAGYGYDVICRGELLVILPQQA